MFLQTFSMLVQHALCKATRHAFCRALRNTLRYKATSQKNYDVAKDQITVYFRSPAMPALANDHTLRAAKTVASLSQSKDLGA